MSTGSSNGHTAPLTTLLALYTHTDSAALEQAVLEAYSKEQLLSLALEDADFITVDPSPWTFDAGQMASNVKWSPYDGMRFGARVSETYLRGQTVYRDGEILGRRGAGRACAGVHHGGPWICPCPGRRTSPRGALPRLPSTGV